MCILESERLILRPPRPSDIQSITAWLGEYDVARMTSRAPHPYGEEDAEGFVASGEPHRFAVTRREDGLFLGLAASMKRPVMSSAIGWASPSGASAMAPKRRTGWWPMPSRC